GPDQLPAPHHLVGELGLPRDRRAAVRVPGQVGELLAAGDHQLRRELAQLPPRRPDLRPARRAEGPARRLRPADRAVRVGRLGGRRPVADPGAHPATAGPLSPPEPKISSVPAGTMAGVTEDPTRRNGRTRIRMTGKERRQQLLDIGRSLFAERGFEATSIEEIAARAGVSKPVVYEHFGGKEGLYAVVVDREMQRLTDRVVSALTAGHRRELLEQAALVFLSYIEDETDGFRILIRDSPVASTTGTFSSLIGDIASQVEYILRNQFKDRGYDTKLAGLYSQALVGMV